MAGLRREGPAATSHLADEKLVIAGFSGDQSTVARESLLVQRERQRGFRPGAEIAHTRVPQGPVFHERIDSHALATIHRGLIVVPEGPWRNFL